jgi:hypothetical protein
MGIEDKKPGPAHWNRVVIPERVKERAHERWEADGDCWISTYSVASHGYAQIGWQNNGKERHVVLAHRASWEHINGPVPQGMTIDHLCKQRRCVNPGHLRVLDNFENARRTRGRDWPLGECANGHSSEYLKDYDGRRHCSICATEIWKSGPRGSRGPRGGQPGAPRKRPAPRTHCRNGHEKTPENSYHRPSGAIECLTCKQEYAKVWVNRKKAA